MAMESPISLEGQLCHQFSVISYGSSDEWDFPWDSALFTMKHDHFSWDLNMKHADVMGFI